MKVSLLIVVENCMSVIHLAAKNKGIAIKTDVPENLFVYTDRLKTETIIRNLTTNAIKFTHEGGKVSISAISENNKAIIAISDNGVGMSSEKLNNLFQLDKVKSESGTNGEKGTGMGLMLCKEFCNMLGGEIWAESTEGEGSVFRFTIPLG